MKRADIKNLKIADKKGAAKARKVNVQKGLDVYAQLSDDNGLHVPKIENKYRRTDIKRRSKQNNTLLKNIRNNIVISLKKIKALITGKKYCENDALSFAINHKRHSKREKRRRNILVYAGAGLVVISAFLLILFGSPLAAGQNKPALQQASAGDKYFGEQPQFKTLGAKMPVLMSFTPAFADKFDYIPPDDIDDFDDIDDIDDYDDVDNTDDIQTPEPEPEPTKPIKTTAPEKTAAPLVVDDFIDYYLVKKGPYYNKMGFSTNHYNYTNKEFTDFAAMLYYEARGEGMTGMVAVGNVIMNRVLCRGAWPNDITSVLSAPGQFTPWKTYQKNGVPSGQYWSKAKKAARAVLDKELWVIPQDVYFFKRGSGAGSNVLYKKIGNHNFFRRGYSGRHRGEEIPPALFDRNYKYPQYGCKPHKRVYRIQYMLNKLGYKVKADGYFGITSKEALTEFQRKNRLKADGVAGPSTIKKLIKKFGIQNYYDKFIK